MSQVWQHYLKIDSTKAKCLKCAAIIKTTSGSTSGLKTHLRTRHDIDIKKKSTAEPSPSTSPLLPVKKCKIYQFFGPQTENSLEAVIARLTAKDGLNFSVFTTSEDLRISLQARGFKVPTSASTIKNMMMKYGQIVEDRLKKHICEKKENNQKFSCTIDEWSSARQHRFVNINLHNFDGSTYNLGLVRYFNKFDGARCEELVKKHLAKFGINAEEDIVACTTDMAKMMENFGKLMPTDHQGCYAHAANLAVTDVLYAKKYEKKSLDLEQADVAQHEHFDEEDDDYDEEGLVISVAERDLEIRKDIQKIIEKVRKIVVTFKKSPLKNDKLQVNACDIGLLYVLVHVEC